MGTVCGLNFHHRKQIMDPTFTQLGIGAAVAYVIYKFLGWIVDGKLHTNSEVDGLKKDKLDLLAANQELRSGVIASNELLKTVVALLEDREPE